MRGANSSESEKEQFWCVKEASERRIRVVLLAKGKGVQGEWESQFGARIPGKGSCFRVPFITFIIIYLVGS